MKFLLTGMCDSCFFPFLSLLFNYIHAHTSILTGSYQFINPNIPVVSEQETDGFPELGSEDTTNDSLHQHNPGVHTVSHQLDRDAQSDRGKS